MLLPTKSLIEYFLIDQEGGAVNLMRFNDFYFGRFTTLHLISIIACHIYVLR